MNTDYIKTNLPELADLSDESSTLFFVLNSIYDGIYITDINRQILFWNKGAELITGYKAEEVLGNSCKDDILNHIDEDGNLLCGSTTCPLLKCMETGTSVRAKVYPKHKDGGRLPVETFIAPLRNKSGKTVAGIEVFRDISVQEEHRIILEKFNKLIRKYVSTTTVDEVMKVTSGEGVRSEYKDISILFMDVVGFTSFSESHSPGEVTRMLNDLFGLCEVITTECHGDIDKFVGDCVMATFIDANDAVHAGAKIMTELKALNKIRENEDKDSITIRIGINSGYAMKCEIGTSERKDLTVIGDTVNTAARIESNSKPGHMCISESTYSRLAAPEEFIKYKEVTVKNKKDPVVMHLYKGEEGSNGDSI